MESLISTLAMVTFYSTATNLLLHCHAIDTPHYTVVRKEVDFEIRLYKDVPWMSAPVRGTSSFRNSTKEGFHRLYQYIHGANRNSTKLAITAPVLTSISDSKNGSPDYLIRLFLPGNYGISAPEPNTELNLKYQRWRDRCVAIRKFTGFADDDNMSKEVQGLVRSLDTAALEHNSSYSIAQYNSSRHKSGRLNEVWMHVSGSAAQGCLSG